MNGQAVDVVSDNTLLQHLSNLRDNEATKNVFKLLLKKPTNDLTDELVFRIPLIDETCREIRVELAKTLKLSEILKDTNLKIPLFVDIVAVQKLPEVNDEDVADL